MIEKKKTYLSQVVYEYVCTTRFLLTYTETRREEEDVIYSQRRISISLDE